MGTAPFSLYIDLVKDKQVDIETVARASLALSAAFREAAYIIDPSLSIRIELVSGTKGSLSLNSVIKSVKSGNLITKKRLRALSMVALVWFGSHVSDKAFDKFWGEIFGVDAAKMSDEEKKEIADLVVAALRNHEAQAHVQDVYRELDQDDAIKGVGATTHLGARPKDIIPKDQFAARSVQDVVLPEDVTKRIRKNRVTIELIGPILRTSKRRWKFTGPEGEFGAYIKDANFMNTLFSGKLNLPLASGIELDVDLETVEEKIAGVWRVLERDVVKVWKVYPPMQQVKIPLPTQSTKKKGAKKAKKK